jgi:hypothetical protein
MRKRIIDLSLRETASGTDTWLDLQQIADVEVSSEDPGFPIEAVFQPHENSGWRAAHDGEQMIRIIFDKPTALHGIQLQFVENEFRRTQELTLRSSSAQGGPAREIVRQQWTFSPEGSTHETEDYDVNLEDVSVLELSIRPDLNAGRGRATLLRWRVR